MTVDTRVLLADDAQHCRIANLITGSLANHLQEQHLGTVDLAVQVLSPSDFASDVFFRRLQALRAGVRAVVEVDPDNRIVYVHRASGTDVVTTISDTALEVDDVVPGWKMPLSEIFIDV
jgi:Uma2 family endonuclease